MGNYKFRFSWFHTSSKITKTQPVTTSSSSFQLSQPSIDERKSYYFTRELTEPVPDPTCNPDPPRKSSKKKKPTSPGHPKLKSPELNLAAECGCQKLKSREVNFPGDESSSPVQSGTCTCKTNSFFYGEVDLPRIITKPAKENEFGSGKWVIDGASRSLSVRVAKEGIIGSPVRKLKGNGYTPRLGNRVRVNGLSGGRRRSGTRRGLSESLAVVKTSVDPGRDFKESMVEMIMENNIKSSKDLEDLLACYLALNSDEYHDLIIKVFKQIWFESTDTRL